MPKALVFTTIIALLFAACGDSGTTSTEPLNDFPNSFNLPGSEQPDTVYTGLVSHTLPDPVAAAKYDSLYNPEGLSPTEYIKAQNLSIDISQELLDKNPNFNPDTIFSWRYQISDEMIDGYSLKRDITIDGIQYVGTWDFSMLSGDFINVFPWKCSVSAYY